MGIVAGFCVPTVIHTGFAERLPVDCRVKPVPLVQEMMTLLPLRTMLNHFHPVLAMFDRHKALSVSVMRVESHVSDSVSGSAFFPAADMPNWHHARWKIDFFAIDGVASSRTISPLRGAI
jgi:hypothetical protein